MITSPIKAHGGKHYLAGKLLEFVPEYLTYVEPYCASAALLFRLDPQDHNEIINDISEEVSNFWGVLRDEYSFEKFKRKVDATPFSQKVYEEADKKFWLCSCGQDVWMAWAFFVKARQSMSARGDCFTPTTKTRTRRGMNEQCSAWLNAIEGLPEVHKRLRRVLIRNEPALRIISEFNLSETFFYLDPPYHPSTRTAKEVYKFEMSEADHEELLKTITSPDFVAKAMISGYSCDVYEDYLTAWRSHEFNVANHSGSGATKQKRVEKIWYNYDLRSA